MPLFPSPKGLPQVVAVAAEDVQGDGHVQVLGARPQGVVVARREGKLRGGDLPHHHSGHPGLAAALHLFDGRLDPVRREQAEADEPVRGRRTVVRQPVVVDPGARLFQVAVAEDERLQAVRRIQHLRADPVAGHLVDPFRLVHPAGSVVPPCSSQVGSAVAERPGKVLLPQARRLDHVRVRRDKRLIDRRADLGSVGAFEDPPWQASSCAEGRTFRFKLARV